MGQVINAGFKNATWGSRKLKILPDNMDTPQGAVDVIRGKTAPHGGSILGKPLKRLGKQSRTLLGTKQKEDSKGKSLK